MINLDDKVKGVENFTYREFVRSDVARRLKIDNIPQSDVIWENIEKLAIHCLQPIRNKFGPIIITSGYRSPALCRAIGSTLSSNHILGQAADFEFLDKNIRILDAFYWIGKNLLFRELILEYYPHGWIHIAYREGGNTKSIKVKDDTHNYTLLSSIDDIYTIYKNKEIKK